MNPPAGALATGGVCVSCGNSTHQKTAFDVRDFYLKSDVRLHGFYLGGHLAHGVVTPLLSRLAALVAGNLLRTPIDAELPWTEVAEAARRLSGQGVDGKIVLTVARSPGRGEAPAARSPTSGAAGA